MVGAGGEFSKNVPVNDNDWHHIATTYGGGTKKIYVDGVEVATASQTGSVTASNYKLALGHTNPFGNPDRPNLDDVRFYSVALSDAEVSALYNDGAGDIGEPKFAITSPSTIKASVGRSISYQITTDTAYGMTGYNSTIAYEILNAPSWLSVDSGSGSVTDTSLCWDLHISGEREQHPRLRGKGCLPNGHQLCKLELCSLLHH